MYQFRYVCLICQRLDDYLSESGTHGRHNDHMDFKYSDDPAICQCLYQAILGN